MAERTFAIVQETALGVRQWLIPSVAAGDTITPLEVAGSPGDLAIAAVGTWDGMTITAQVSEDRVTPRAAKDTDGGGIALTSDGGANVRDLGRYLHLAITAGSGAEDVAVRVTARYAV